MKKTGLFILILISLYGTGFADGFTNDFSKGPLYGKNMYIPYLIHYHLPALPARSGRQYDLQFDLINYLAQDILIFIPDEAIIPPGRNYNRNYIAIDYEVYAAELGISYNILDELQLGVNFRFFSFSGGFLDSFIESFHNLFDFPGGGREYIEQNRIHINIPNNNGLKLYLDKAAVSMGDTDLWGKWTFFENNTVSLAALSAFKVPTGALEKLSGSNYPDIALGLLFDWRIAAYCTLYTHAGLVVPFNGKSFPMFNGMFGAEIHPWELISFIVQMNIKTSPIADDTSPGAIEYKLSLPQTNILGGLVVRFNKTRMQIYFEQDAFTYRGADITFGFMVSHTVTLPKR